MKKIEYFNPPKKVSINLPPSLICQKTEVKKILEKEVLLFGRISQKGICIIGNADSSKYELVREKYVSY